MEKILTAKEWLLEMSDIKPFLKKGISVKTAALMIENYTAYKINKMNEKPVPSMVFDKKLGIFVIGQPSPSPTHEP